MLCHWCWQWFLNMEGEVKSSLNSQDRCQVVSCVAEGQSGLSSPSPPLQAFILFVPSSHTLNTHTSMYLHAHTNRHMAPGSKYTAEKGKQRLGEVRSDGTLEASL